MRSKNELNFESEWIIKAISHDIRRSILYMLSLYPSLAYTEILEKLNLSTGKLNFHLRRLEGLIFKDQESNYRLGMQGKQALILLQEIDEMKTASFSNSIQQYTEREILFTIEPGEELVKKQQLIALLLQLFFYVSLIVVYLVLNRKTSYKKITLIDHVFLSLLLLGIIVYFLMRYNIEQYVKRLLYQVETTELVIKKGIITESISVIPFRTITNLVIRRGVFDRLFGISTLIVETASRSGESTKPEGKMIGIYDADEVIEEILSRVRMLDPPQFISNNIQSEEKIAISKTKLRQIKVVLNDICKKIQD